MVSVITRYTQCREPDVLDTSETYLTDTIYDGVSTKSVLYLSHLI